MTRAVPPTRGVRKCDRRRRQRCGHATGRPAAAVHKSEASVRVARFSPHNSRRAHSCSWQFARVRLSAGMQHSVLVYSRLHCEWFGKSACTALQTAVGMWLKGLRAAMLLLFPLLSRANALQSDGKKTGKGQCCRCRCRCETCACVTIAWTHIEAYTGREIKAEGVAEPSDWNNWPTKWSQQSRRLLTN